MNAHRVVAEVICEDDRTMNGVRKAGFIAEGLSRQTMYLDGKYYDEAVFSMLRPDYERVKNG
jgi:RimJ/RimL family protein N-acetyltransferase